MAGVLLSLANDSVSIAASIILFPLMIEVVQMTMFLRAASRYRQQTRTAHDIIEEHTYLLPSWQ